MITFDDYQDFAASTKQYPDIGHGVIYPTIGLAGETGEVCDKIKKIFRDCDGKFTPSAIHSIRDELGDVLWYISQISTELGISLTEVASRNAYKLKARQVKNTIKGSGDNR